jgi:hypothetical protein
MKNVRRRKLPYTRAGVGPRPAVRAPCSAPHMWTPGSATRRSLTRRRPHTVASIGPSATPMLSATTEAQPSEAQH